MIRFVPISILALLGILLAAGSGQAQVFVRAPFVRVFVGPGGGVYVRAPFVRYSNMWGPPAPSVVEPTDEELPPPQPLPKKLSVPDKSPAPGKSAAPAKGALGAMTLSEFANTFQPRGGRHEVLLINPLTKKATTVRFSLPEGLPRRVVVDPQGVEFVYGLRHFVRIHFNADGPVITSR